MGTKHTPGPWVVHCRVHQKRGNKENRSRSVWRESESGAVRHIADVKGDIGPPSVSDANAALIAAAPDLLAACEEALHFLDDASGTVSMGWVKAVLSGVIQKAQPQKDGEP